MHRLEEEFNLVEHKFAGVYAWPAARIAIYYALTVAAGTYQESIATTGCKRTFFKRLVDLGCQFIRNPFFAWGAISYAIYVHSRKVNGKDIYSDALVQQYGDSALLLDSTFTGSERLQNAADMGFFTTLAVMYRRMKMKGSTFSDDEDVLIKTIQGRIKKQFGQQVDVKKILQRRLFLFKFLKPVYKALFRYRKVQEVYIVNAYSYPYITAAAQELGLTVTELQHGLITPYHMGYSYPGREKVPYFPDRFYGFGQYWLESVDMPTATKKKVIGAPHMATLKSKNIDKIPGSVFFSSQTVIGQQVFNFAAKTAELLPKHKITLNLHPNDSRDLYPASGLPENLEILYKPANFFEILAAHEYQAGSFSTTLFEGMLLGNKVIVLDLPGAENMQPAIERGDAIFAQTPEELVGILHTAHQAKDAEVYYADLVQKISA